MIRRIEREQLQSEISALKELLAAASESDPLARISLESRLHELITRLELLGETEAHHASVALYFGGAPVIGSRAIQAEFAAEVLGNFQEIVARTWMIPDNAEVAPTGPINLSQSSALHLTNIVHGSFGFVLEEADDTDRLFPSPLKQAVERASDIVARFGDADEEKFSEIIDEVHPRVFNSVRDFFRGVHKNRAVFRVVSDEIEKQFDSEAVNRAFDRAEASSVDEKEISLEGELLGIIPIARRFEFKPNRMEVISGRVGTTLSQSYLERVEKETFAGRTWIAKLRWREVKRFGKRVESYLLLDLVARS